MTAHSQVIRLAHPQIPAAKGQGDVGVGLAVTRPRARNFLSPLGGIWNGASRFADPHDFADKWRKMSCTKLESLHAVWKICGRPGGLAVTASSLMPSHP